MLMRCHLRLQHAMSFAMAPYLLGFKGPAQCIEFEPKPMKVHVVPRSGAEPQVMLPRRQALCAALSAVAAGQVLVRHVASAEGGIGHGAGSYSQLLAVEGVFCFQLQKAEDVSSVGV